MNRSKEALEKRIEYLQQQLYDCEYCELVDVDGIEWQHRHVWGAIQDIERRVKWM